MNNDLTLQKQISLRKMKLVASGVLVLFGVLFLISDSMKIGWLEALSEAALIGGLADWFAVEALFRHPLGIKIPHTALIPKNKNKIGKNLGVFISQEFLTFERLEPKIRDIDFGEKIASWLTERENASKVAGLAINELIPAILDVIQDEDIKSFLHEQFESKIDEINFSQWLGVGLETLTHDGRHQVLFTTILEKLHEELMVHTDQISSKVSEKTPWWSFGIANEKISNDIIEALEEFLYNAKNPNSEVRKKVNLYMEQFISDLKHSDEMQKRVNSFIAALKNNENVQEYIEGIWDEIKVWIYDDLSKENNSTIRNKLINMLVHVGIGLSQDFSMKNKINQFIKTTLLEKVINSRFIIGNFIASTVENWDTVEISQKLELEIGRDLQYIRLNGTVVGGLIGLLIYLAAR